MKTDEKILFIVNNGCVIKRPPSRYIFTIETLAGDLVCMSMYYEEAIDGAVRQIKKARKRCGIPSGNWMHEEWWAGKWDEVDHED